MSLLENKENKTGPEDLNIERSFSSLLIPQHGISLFLEKRHKIIHFIRHAEGFHNVETKKMNGSNYPLEYTTPNSEKFIDARLSAKGAAQCNELKRKMAFVKLANPRKYNIELVVVSPFTRALETANLVLGPFDFPGVPPVIINELIRERSGRYTCDKMRPKDVVLSEFPVENVDSTRWVNEKDIRMQFLIATNNLDWTTSRESSASVNQRAILFLLWIRNRPEQEIAVVTHSSFLRHLFSQFGDNVDIEDAERMQRNTGNCEMRSIVMCMHAPLSKM